MAQLSYNMTMTAGQAGLVADVSYVKDVASRVAEGEILPGAGVIQGTTAGVDVKVPTATSTKFEGVALLTVLEQVGGVAKHQDKDTTAVIREGKVWVEVTEAVAYGDAAYLQFGATNKGKFSKTTGADNFAVTGAKFLTATSGAGLAVLELA